MNIPDLTNYREILIAKAERHHELTGIKREVVANRVVKDARFFDRLEEGGGCTVDTFQKLIDWFTKNTPSKKLKRAASNHSEEAAVNIS